jgi:hypothetical protein
VPKNKALNEMKKRLGLENTEKRDGLTVLPLEKGAKWLPDAVKVVDMEDDSIEKLPPYVAWSRFRKVTHELENVELAIAAFQPTEGIKSDQWIYHGLYQWWRGMKKCYALMALTMSHPDLNKVKAALQILRQRGLSANQLTQERYKILGPEPDGGELQEFMCAFTHLHGKFLMFETDPARFIESPPWLGSFPNRQYMSTGMSVVNITKHLHEKFFAGQMLTSSGVVNMCSMFYASIGMRGNNPESLVAATPTEVVNYCKKKLREGVTWDGGMRKFVSLQYRGTVMAATMMRLIGQLALAVSDFKWARKFIELADSEWKVSSEGTFAEKGSCFQSTFKIGVMSAELDTSIHLQTPGVPPNRTEAESVLTLAAEIVSMAEAMNALPDRNSYIECMHDVSFRRKPLALAHSLIAMQLMTLTAKPSLFMDISTKIGLCDEDDHRNPYAIISEHYRKAAQAQLQDDDEAPIFWWGYAGNMVRAGNVRGDSDSTKEGYCMGELRAAIMNAREASKKRDVGLYGRDKRKNGTYEMQARIVARHYQNKCDAFIIPMLELQPSIDGNIAMSIDGNVLCIDFEKYVERECNRLFEDKDLELMDTSELEKEHGAEESF